MEQTPPFPILRTSVRGKRLVYLDNAATTQKPQEVLDALDLFYRTTNANIHRGIHHLAEKATMAYEHARDVVAQFIGAQTDEIIFTSGTTQGLNQLSRMLGSRLQPGDEIVLTIMEHHSNLLPWLELAREKKATVRYIPLTTEYELDLVTARTLITAKTKIVAFAHVSNTLGTIAPAKELIQLAHTQGAVTVIDAAQSVGHMPVNVNDLDCDFLVFSGHKTCGPTGIGVLYGKKRLLQKMEPSAYGGGMVEEIMIEESAFPKVIETTHEKRTEKRALAKTSWLPPPHRFEAGTPNIAGAIGLATALTFLNERGLKNIEEHGATLRSYALEQLHKNTGVRIVGPQKTAGAIISFTVEGIHPHDLAEILNGEGVAIRAGRHCTIPLLKRLNLTEGTARASFYLYNTTEDIDALVRGITKAQQVFHS
ncbi:aminotransferase class V-fold PLP-dependent enzyme [Candidatus Woesearchaeota archaeon]|nr:aminotransferase class V-fold PLP-dependent enzyme [Candidatus Woesearchaeota archaeon]